jgi:zinc D-Ala-D-Ala carboxypeptidase
MQLSNNFWLHEFLRSETASRAGRIIEEDSHATKQLERLCQLVLQPIRDHLSRPITILSGYRPIWLNRLVGGSATSEHVFGRAADFIVSGMRPFEVAQAISPLLAQLPVNQLIHEFGRWTHISVCAPNQIPKRQVLTATKQHGRKTAYIVGLQDVQL